MSQDLKEALATYQVRLEQCIPDEVLRKLMKEQVENICMFALTEGHRVSIQEAITTVRREMSQWVK